MCASHLELCELLHELLLLLAVAEGRQDVEEDLEVLQALPRHVGQGEDGSDAGEESHTHVNTLPSVEMCVFILR